MIGRSSVAADPAAAVTPPVKDAMNRPHLLIVAAAVSLAMSNVVAAPVAAAAACASNPFAKVSTLPFQYPAFDKIKDADFTPAFEAGMRENLREIDAIANNRKPATFDNTIVAMERSGQLLTRVNTTFSNLQAPIPTTSSTPSTPPCRRNWPPTTTPSF